MAYMRLPSVILLSGIVALSVACTMSNLLPAPPGAMPSAVLHNQDSIRLFEEGKLDMARQAIEAALTEDFDFAEAHYNLAMILEHQGHREEAKQHYFQAANLAPGHTIILNSPPLRPYEPGRGQLFPLLPKYMPKWSPLLPHPTTSATPGGRHAITEWEAHEH